MFDKAKKLYELKRKADQLKKELSTEIIEAEAGDGAVVVEVDGEQKVRSIKIDAGKVGISGDTDRLERLLSEAVKQALAESQKVAAERGKAFFKEFGGGEGLF